MGRSGRTATPRARPSRGVPVRAPASGKRLHAPRPAHQIKPRYGRAIPKPGKSFGDVHPELIAQWVRHEDGLGPFDVKPGSNDAVRWRCPECAHEWSATVNKRTSGRGCPECANRERGAAKRRPKSGESFGDVHPELIPQWVRHEHGLGPFDVKPKSNDTVEWRCPECAREWAATVNSRTSGSGCPECANRARNESRRRPKPGESFGDVRPELIPQWVRHERGLGPFDVKPKSNDTVEWRCPECAHEWSATVNKRTSGCGCIECGRRLTSAAKRVPRPGRSFGDVYPELIPQWVRHEHGLGPFDVKPRSKDRVEWRCSECAHEWPAIISNRAKGHGCPACALIQLARRYPARLQNHLRTLPGGFTVLDFLASQEEREQWVRDTKLRAHAFGSARIVVEAVKFGICKAADLQAFMESATPEELIRELGDFSVLIAAIERIPLPESTRKRIKERDRGEILTCLKCGTAEDETRMHVDHFLPRAWGGTNRDDNLWTLCSSCNVRKTAYMPNDEEIAAWVAHGLPQPSCWDEVHVIAGKNPKPWPAADKTADPFAASPAGTVASDLTQAA